MSSGLKLFFSCSNPLIAAPQELPAKIPSSRAFCVYILPHLCLLLFQKHQSRPIDVFWKNILSYSFSDIWVNFIFIKDSRFVVFFKNRTIGVNSPDLNIWIFFFQKFTNTRNSSTRSYSNNKMGYFSICLFPDFRPCLFVMSKGI